MRNINKKYLLKTAIGVLVYLLSYCLSPFFIDYNNLHDLKIFIDDLIPFYSPSIIIYCLAFFQWIYACYLLCIQKNDSIYAYVHAIAIGSIIGFVIFIAYPTFIVRPIIETNSFFDRLTSFIYRADIGTTSAFPSFHCFCSTISFFIARDYANSKIKIINLILSILIYASTVLTKQHVIVDIPSGILLALISITIGKYIHNTIKK